MFFVKAWFQCFWSSLVEILEEKGILTQEEWEKKIKSKLEKNSKSFREIQF